MDTFRTLAISQGYFTRPDVLRAGYDDRLIARARAGRVWTRIRQGVYTYTDLWALADPLTRHRIEAHAVARRLGPNVMLSHTSAAVMHGLALWDVDLGAIHVTRLDGAAGHTEAGIVHHEGTWRPDELVERDGVPVTAPARAALETAMLVSQESAVVLLDSALHDHCTEAELEKARRELLWWPGSRRLEVTTRLADGGSESVGESRSRYLCYRFNLPAPVLQFEVYTGSGVLLGRSDFAWPDHALLGEFDGRSKYGRLLRAGETPQDAVFREKRREDLLREVTGWSMIRLTWPDLADGPATAARIRRLLIRAA